MIAFLLAAALLAQAPAGPTPANEAIARSRFEQGRLAYDLGRFDEALAHFEAAYAAVPLPGFLFNLGQCHLQRGDTDRAVFFYERYLELAPDASNADVTRELLAEARLKQQQQQPQPPPAVDATPPAAPLQAVQPVLPAATEPEDDGAAWWVVGGVATAGVVALASGAVAVLLLWPQEPATSLGSVDLRAP